MGADVRVEKRVLLECQTLVQMVHHVVNAVVQRLPRRFEGFLRARHFSENESDFRGNSGTIYNFRPCYLHCIKSSKQHFTHPVISWSLQSQ